MKTQRKTQGVNATGLQVRRAFESKFNKSCGDVSFQMMAQELVDVMGLKAAGQFVLSQSNDPAFETAQEKIDAAARATKAINE